MHNHFHIVNDERDVQVLHSDANAHVIRDCAATMSVNGFGIDTVGDRIGNVEPNTWPFHCDFFNMGSVPAKDFAVMYSRFGEEQDSNGFPDRNEYIIIHHIPTGKRLRILLPTE